MKNGCRLSDIANKDVIVLSDGRKLGLVYDLEFDGVTGEILSLIVPSRPKFFGLFGKTREYLIPWEEINKIGRDSILIEDLPELPTEPPVKNSIFGSFRF